MSAGRQLARRLAPTVYLYSLTRDVPGVPAAELYGAVLGPGDDANWLQKALDGLEGWLLAPARRCPRLPVLHRGQSCQADPGSRNGDQRLESSRTGDEDLVRAIQGRRAEGPSGLGGLQGPGQRRRLAGDLALGRLRRRPRS